MWALHKHFPNVKIYVRAHDVMHGLNLEKVWSQAQSTICCQVAEACWWLQRRLDIFRGSSRREQPYACTLDRRILLVT